MPEAAPNESLKKQLTADDSSETLGVVYHLKDATTGAVETRKIAKRLLKEAAAASGHAPLHSNVFENLASFVVEAPARFHRELVDRSEIGAAVLNRLSAPLEPIRPVRIGPARAEGWAGKAE